MLCFEIGTPSPFSPSWFQSEELTYKGRVNALNCEERPELTKCNGLVFPDSVARQFTKDRRAAESGSIVEYPLQIPPELCWILEDFLAVL